VQQIRIRRDRTASVIRRHGVFPARIVDDIPFIVTTERLPSYDVLVAPPPEPVARQGFAPG
jgi:hypothetical protein